MKTKDFIKILQDADPSGEGHIRLDGGVPTYAIEKPGYYDGPYNYIDAEGNYVTSINGYKVDVYSVDLESFVIDRIDIHDENNWENIKSKLKFEFGGYAIPEQRSEREEAIIKNAKAVFDEYAEWNSAYYKKKLDIQIANAEKGWSWFQNKKVDEDRQFTYSGWKIFDENGKPEHNNLYNVECALKSDKWKRVDNNIIPGYYQWVFEGKEEVMPNLGNLFKKEPEKWTIKKLINKILNK